MKNKLIGPVSLLAMSLFLAGLVACGAATNSQAPAPGINPSSVTAGNQTQTANAPRGGAPAGGQATAPAAKPASPALRITADGRLSFVTHRTLTFGTSGTVAEVHVSDLDKVTKGKVLARLDTTSQDKAVRAAEIALKAVELSASSADVDRQVAEYSVKSAQADLKQMQDNIKSAGIDLQTASNSLAKISYPYTYTTFSIDIPTAIASIASAQLALNVAAADLQPGTANYGDALAKLNNAQTNLTVALQQMGRGANLDAIVASANQTKGGVATTALGWATTDIWTITAAQLAVDKAQMTVTSAQNAADKTTLAVGNAQSALNKAKLAVDKARNDVDKARNDLDKAKDDRDKAIITAPIDGVVAGVNVKEGDTLSSGNYATTVAIDLIDPGRMELNFQVNELDIPGVKPGQKVAITVNALPGERISAVVISVSTLPGTEGGVVSYQVKTVFDVPKNSLLRAGMAATADITIDQPK